LPKSASSEVPPTISDESEAALEEAIKNKSDCNTTHLVDATGNDCGPEALQSLACDDKDGNCQDGSSGPATSSANSNIAMTEESVSTDENTSVRLTSMMKDDAPSGDGSISDGANRTKGT